MRACAGSVKLLLANGRVDPNIAEQNGNTALMGAADKGHASVVTLLLADERVDPKIADQNGNPAFELHDDLQDGHKMAPR